MNEKRLKVEEWENQSGYGTHRICKYCNDATVETMTYGYRIKCRVKHGATGSGSVKPSHSCINWNPKIPEIEGMQLVNAYEYLNRQIEGGKG